MPPWSTGFAFQGKEKPPAKPEGCVLTVYGVASEAGYKVSVLVVYQTVARNGQEILIQTDSKLLIDRPAYCKLP
jgi:hypothetical protein